MKKMSSINNNNNNYNNNTGNTNNSITTTTHNNNEKVRLALFAHGLVVSGGSGGGTTSSATNNNNNNSNANNNVIIINPFAIVTLLANHPNEQPQILGRTETIYNTRNPKWKKYFDIDYNFTKITRINIGIYNEVTTTTSTRTVENEEEEEEEEEGNNHDEENNNSNNNVLIGSAVFEIAEIIGSKIKIRAKRLRKQSGLVFTRIVVPTKKPQTTTTTSDIVPDSNPIFTTIINNDNDDDDDNATIKITTTIPNNKRGQEVTTNNDNDDDNNTTTTNNRTDPDVTTSSGNNKEISLPPFPTKKAESVHEIRDVFSDMSLSSSPPLTTRTKSVGSSFVPVNASSAASSCSSSSPTTTNTSKKQPAGAIECVETPFSATISTITSSSSQISVSAYFQQQQQVGPVSPVTTSNTYSPTTRARSSLPGVVYECDNSVPLFPVLSENDEEKQPYRPSFSDYLVGGCEIELSIAIDFTGSNGDPRIPGTLHHIRSDGVLNDYEKAITAVGGIIARYDTDQRFPVLGFGAKYNGQIQHCFQVGPTPEVYGISGILQAYRNIFRSGIVMSGPTVFSDLIDYSAAVARQNATTTAQFVTANQHYDGAQQQQQQQQQQQTYRILLILTDGVVSDIEQTKRSLKAACDAPLSVVIVGIGSADFTPMQELDDFHQQGENNNDESVRDICQFVQFNKYANDKAALTNATLEEIPDQLVDYFFTRNGILPLPPNFDSQYIHSNGYWNNPTDVGEEEYDLNMIFTSDGTFRLANNYGAIYNDSLYGSYSTYVAAPTINNNNVPCQSAIGMYIPMNASPIHGGGPYYAGPHNMEMKPNTTYYRNHDPYWNHVPYLHHDPNWNHDPYSVQPLVTAAAVAVAPPSLQRYPQQHQPQRHPLDPNQGGGTLYYTQQQQQNHQYQQQQQQQQHHHHHQPISSPPGYYSHY